MIVLYNNLNLEKNYFKTGLFHMEKIISKALSLDSETEDVEFKGKFDTNSNEDWCEIIKDIVAIANSGGGVIVFGLDDHGNPSENDISNLEELDSAHIVDKIKKYTDYSFSDFQIKIAEKENAIVYVLLISRCNIPMIFTSPGTYQISPKQQKRAFSKGTIYFRHGAKSEPGSRSDIQKSIQKEIVSIRDSWLSNIRKVIEAPIGSQAILIAPNKSTKEEYTPLPIQVVTDDPSAPKYAKISPDTSHPYRMTEVVEKVNKQIKGVEINQYDLVSINAAHETKKNEDFCYKPKFSTFQYSSAYIGWIISKYKMDNGFFDKARKEYRKIRNNN